jgi:IS5 family transposase
MLRTVGDRPSLWESLLPAEVLQLPEELARVDALLDDPVSARSCRTFTR